MAAFTDRPTSARGPDRRPGEAALIDAIRNGTIDRVLIWSVCRIGKSLPDLVVVHGDVPDGWRRPYGSMSKGSTLRPRTECRCSTSTAMMALHLRQSRRDRILRGQAAARSLSIRFGRPPIPTAKIEKAKDLLAMGKGVREVARLAGGISPSSVSRIAASLRSTAAV